MLGEYFARSFIQKPGFVPSTVRSEHNHKFQIRREVDLLVTSYFEGIAALPPPKHPDYDGTGTGPEM